MRSATRSARSQTNRRRFYLARGEYEWPCSTDLMHPCPDGTSRAEDLIARPRLSVATGRILTLTEASYLEPKLLEKLSEILPTLVRSGWDEKRDGILNHEALQREPKLRKLRSELEEWGGQFQLLDSWCLEIALTSLRMMRHHGQLEWFDVRTHFNKPDPFYVKFATPFNLPPYDPVYERRARYLSNVRKVLNPKYQDWARELDESVQSDDDWRFSEKMKELAEREPRRRRISIDCEQLILDYIERVEMEARRQGLVAVPVEIRQPLMFRWLAGQQLFGWTPRQIAMATNIYKGSAAYHNTVVYGVEKIRNHIGLSPRRDRVLSPRGQNLKQLVARIRDSMDPQQIEARKRRLSRFPAFISDDRLREAAQVIRDCQINFPEMVD